MKDLENKRDCISIIDEDLLEQMKKLGREKKKYVTMPLNSMPFLQTGRIVKIAGD